MKNLIRKATTLLCSVFVIALVGCAKNDSTVNLVDEVSSDSHYPVTITTYNYEKEAIDVTFTKAPEKVVAVYQNSIETLLALGLEDRIVAAAGLDHDVKKEYQDAFSKVNYLAEFTPSKESVIMEQPDFILGWYSLFDEKNLGDVDYWHENGTNTYMSLNSGVSQERTIENEIIDILNLGKIFNVEDKAELLVKEIKSKLESIELNEDNNQSTMVIEFFDDEIYTYGANTLVGDMVTKLQGNILNPAGGNIGIEDLLNLNPDCIFISYMDGGNENIPTEEINKVLNNPALASLSAVKNNRVYAIPLGEMYASGIRTIDGLNTISNGLYGNE
ncbi:MAG: ABC transporter substrate-binding protein [Clostridium sp.]|nr:ABC transporter substrate-binding protein [Clostridium sp.]